MRLYENMPCLTITEAQRFWLRPDEVLEVAALWDQPEARKFFGNVTDRGLIPFRRFDDKRTSPRLYNLACPVIARIMWEMVRRGRTYDFAAAAGREAALSVFDAVKQFPTLADFLVANPWRIVLVRQPSPAGPAEAKTLQATEVTADTIEDFAWITCEVIALHGVVRKVLTNYAEVWHRDLEKKRSGR